MAIVSEAALNVALAELLSERGLKAVGEVIIKRGRPDVLILLNGVKIIIEGKLSQEKLDEAVKKCEERIDEGLADICLALWYSIPHDRLKIVDQRDVKDMLLRGKYNVKLVTYLERANLTAFIPNWRRDYKEYNDISFDELVKYLLDCYSETVAIDVVEQVANKIDRNLEALTTLADDIGLVKRLRSALELYEEKEAEEDEG